MTQRHTFRIGDRILLNDVTSPYDMLPGVVIFAHTPACEDGVIVRLEGIDRQQVFRAWQLAPYDGQESAA